jgi:murein DD-endopeptidase MepM/ murein hydrolase activator NlpD
MKWLVGLCLICLPLKHFKINSYYGIRLHPISGKYAMHYGIDLKARNDTVYAIMNGRVISENYDPLLGINLHLSHGQLESIYGHLSQLLVGEQDSVFAGQPIAITGATGRVTGEHLHFSLRYRQRYINPIKFFYELLNNQQNERKFQTTAGSAIRKAGR